MRVLLWSELFWPYLGGVEILAIKFVRAMQARGHEFAVITSHAELELSDEDQRSGARVWRLPFRAALAARDLGGLQRVRRRVLELTRAFDPDLIHLYALGSSAVFVPQARGNPPRPLVLTLHGEILRESAGGQDTVLEKILRTASWTAGVSMAVQQRAHRLSPELVGRSSVVYNALDVPPLRPGPLPRAEPRLLCLGRLVSDKGFDLAVTALAALLPRFPHARLLVAGDGPVRLALARQSTDLGVSEAVDFLGWIAPERVPELLNQATIVVMPSRREGLPLVAIQAAQMARPVVGSRVGGLAEVVVHDETGLLVAPDDHRALVDALAALLSRPELAERLGQAARARAESVFGWDRHLDAYEAVYGRVALRVRDAPTGAGT
jgi:glycogen(starch) synthase